MEAFIVYYYYFMKYDCINNVIICKFSMETKVVCSKNTMLDPKRKKYFGVMNFQDFGLRLLLPPRRPAQWRIALRKNCL